MQGSWKSFDISVPGVEEYWVEPLVDWSEPTYPDEMDERSPSPVEEEDSGSDYRPHSSSPVEE